MTRYWIVLLLPPLLLAACGQRVPANLDEKLDSIRQLEEKEQLQLQGIVEPSNNPLKEFYDSLKIQPLPVHYTKDYVTFCDNFSFVPQAIATYLNLETRQETRAVTLPEHGDLRMMIIAGIDEGETVEMWLYSLGKDFLPIDKMCLYDVADGDEESFFAITSEFEIYRDHVLYMLDSNGIFQEVVVGERPLEK